LSAGLCPDPPGSSQRWPDHLAGFGGEDPRTEKILKGNGGRRERGGGTIRLYRVGQKTGQFFESLKLPYVLT